MFSFWPIYVSILFSPAIFEGDTMSFFDMLIIKLRYLILRGTLKMHLSFCKSTDPLMCLC